MRAMFAGVLAVGLFSCEAEISSRGVLALKASPSPSCAKGRTVRLGARLVYPGGAEVVVTADATWSSNDLQVGDVSGTGLFTCASEGLTTVTARYGDLQSELELTVTPAALDALELGAGATQALPRGMSRQVALTGHFSDGSARDVTHDVVW